jgi:hypothetical protein
MNSERCIAAKKITTIVETDDKVFTFVSNRPGLVKIDIDDGYDYSSIVFDRMYPRTTPKATLSYDMYPDDDRHFYVVTVRGCREGLDYGLLCAMNDYAVFTATGRNWTEIANNANEIAFKLLGHYNFTLKALSPLEVLESEIIYYAGKSNTTVSLWKQRFSLE